MVLHELAQLSDECLDKLSMHIREEKKRRFDSYFNIRDWPRPSFGQTREQYMEMLHSIYREPLTHARMVTDAVWKELGL